ncbi:Ig-like domain-containing protein [Bombella saccharophila]|uniref:Ig-like domain-containing protein n=1 Tax=Bombella saccharophila TaxID=2967338 RepID=A0ABT3W3P4_9PROT|nr:Ig-like domain-containing protein [Bombella saccharophila]MCX5613662.1 Ig-like domain-containing protein [Bombella saccharophila]PHI97557.1 hypothetical protein BG621_02075 [Parasaccharibacter apium]
MFVEEVAVQRSGFLQVGVVATALLALGGCAANQKKAPDNGGILPNPFANEKRAAHCEVSPLQTDATGRMSVMMTVMAGDGGMCPFAVSKGGGGSYVSFGVVPPPEHGKAFLYSYDNRTYVEYTPAVDYKGEDSFSVELIPGSAQPRRMLTVKVSVEQPAATTAATPPVEAAVKPVTPVHKRRIVAHKAAGQSTSK